MKYENILPHRSDNSVPMLSDKEIEARVFRNLEATRKEWAEEHEGAVVLLQYPDNRTLFQRMAARWYLRSQRVQLKTQDEGGETGSEPDWPGHWATVKYL
ncbi:hypothetical protein [uncultured Roseobacter sp.]|uniref:hypothetical protein n=1 Tax=uncultured Roseobacter sp. TaxID=114847 RepID=UPI00260D4032|nr:hypothetical protein [uncultured Roseobacter sp.]